MLKILRENSVFTALTATFLVLQAYYSFTYDQNLAVFFFGAHRTVALDFFFTWATRMGEVPLFIFFTLLFVALKNKYMARKIALSGVAALVLSASLKAFFAHPRPVTFYEFTNPALLSQANLINGFEILRGGASFPSGHTTAAFALYGILAFNLPKTFWYASACFLMAAMVGISRVYVVAHYPKDVFFGTFLGVLSALMVQYWFNYNSKNRATAL